MRGEAHSLHRKGRVIMTLGVWLAFAGLLLPLPARAQATPSASACANPTPVATMVPGDGTGGSVPPATPAPVGLATPVMTDCLKVTLSLDKREVGSRVLTFMVKDASGEPVSDATVTVRTQSLEMGQISSYTAKMTKPGVYVASAVSMGTSGKWQVDVLIGRPNIGRAEAVFVFSLIGQ